MADDVDPSGLLKKQLSEVEKELRQTNKTILQLQEKQKTLKAKQDQLKFQLQQESSKKLASIVWDTEDYSWSKELQATMVHSFKISKLRPHQLSIMNATLSGQDCILIMPTGGGKSLCFQLPAMLSKGITVVVSPLVSLMEDQLMALHALGLPADMLNCSRNNKEVRNILKEMVQIEPKLKILYVTPERLAKSKRTMGNLQKMYQLNNFARLAIDEVHCCSQWGHDFRPDYKYLGIMKKQFPKVPIIGLTATATSNVISDVEKILNIPGCLILKASFNRPNLKYKVCPKSSKNIEAIEDLEKLITGRFKNQSGIIYCFSINESEDVASKLRERGIAAQSYHAQLDPMLRSAVHLGWSKNVTQVVVATVAFGMGIDKPDVRFVIHYSMSKSMENFYQESGRAGRDDQLAHCILFYRFADIFRQSTMVFSEQTGLENLYAMAAYCTDSKRCRRAIIAQHFGELWESSDCNLMCDHCNRSNKTGTEETDCTQHCQDIYKIIRHATALQERLTAQKLVDAWVGKGHPSLRTGTVSKLPRITCELIVALLLIEGYLKEEFHFTPYTTISYINTGPKALSVDDGNHRVVLELPSSRIQMVTSTTRTKIKEKPGQQKRITDSSVMCEMNFDQWNDILSSKEEKKTVKKPKIDVIDAKPIIAVPVTTTPKKTSNVSRTDVKPIARVTTTGRTTPTSNKSPGPRTTTKEKLDRRRPIAGSSSTCEMNFDEWNNIPSSKEEKKTVKKPKIEVIDVID